RVERVVDGDTIALFIDCGFYTWIKLKARLRGIDCPELTTTQGVLARRFVRNALKAPSFVVVKTCKADKYGRYLADIFYDAKEKDPAVVAEKGSFLNQDLIDEGLAEMYNKK
ncbi:MAG: thermonuclease family protein, partial [Candidatus Omnitrophica bacterium]|nr:thermonuclease family protein [Candidatus Omnitrophota bacterium]